jgi:hypothetical protein
MTKRRTVVLVLGLACIALLSLAHYFITEHKTPAGQRPLTDLDSHTLEAFKAQFNGAKDRNRIILLLSPT